MTAFTRSSAPRSSALASAAALLLAGCAGPMHLEPPVQPPSTFSASGNLPAPERWWTAFGDATLDSLVDGALAGNFDLQSAWQRLEQARAVVDRESASRWPGLDLLLGATARDPEPAGFEALDASLVADYEVDLWGRLRARTAAERFRARASLSDYRTAALTLSAETAAGWFRLLEARRQAALLGEQYATNESILALIRARVGSGQVRGVDILRQRQLLEATREQQIAAAARVRVLEHGLAVLLGQPPGAALPGDNLDGGDVDGGGLDLPTLPTLPALPAAGVPADLIARRPDVQRMHDRLLAADRDLAAAAAQRYPRLTLSASAASSGDAVGDLTSDWVQSLTAGLLGPLFDGGARGAEVDRTEAARRQALADYGQAVLDAVRDVEDALVQEQAQTRRLAALERQHDYVQRTLEQLRAEYLNGLVGYLDVLTALTDEQRLRRDLLAARLTRLEVRIGLYRALAGPIESRLDPSTDPSRSN
jgi:NodT family efflux transporter outer membrane factor (OMF) lipoprotein